MSNINNTYWSDAINLEFVKLYLKHECLWNPVHSGYKLKYLRKKAQTNIISEFESITKVSLNMADVANKIKNLRTGYGNKLNKISKKLKIGRTYKPSASWFHEMDRYLKRVPGHRHAVIQYSQETVEEDSEEEQRKVCQVLGENELQSINLEEDDTDSSPLIIEDSIDKFDVEEPKIKFAVLQSPLQCPITYSPLHSNSDSMNSQEMPNIKIEVLPPPLQCPVTQTPSNSLSDNTMIEDEFSIYGKLIASHLRKLNSQNALQLQLQIQNLINSEDKLSELRS